MLAIPVIVLASLALTRGELSSTAAHEGPCLSPPTINDPGAWKFLFSYTGVWHIPLASEFMARKNAEVFLGYSPRDASHLAEMNWKAVCNPSGCNHTGYGTNFYEACAPIAVGVGNPAVITEYSCPTVEGLSPAPGWKKYSGIDPLINPVPAPRISIIYTDFNSVVVFSLCVDGTDRGFSVFNTSPTFTKKQNTDVAVAVERSGYRRSNFHYF